MLSGKDKPSRAGTVFVWLKMPRCTQDVCPGVRGVLLCPGCVPVCAESLLHCWGLGCAVHADVFSCLCATGDTGEQLSPHLCSTPSSTTSGQEHEAAEMQDRVTTASSLFFRDLTCECFTGALPTR